MSKTVTFNVVSASFIIEGTLHLFFPNPPPKLSLPALGHLVTGLISLFDVNAINGSGR